MKRITLILLAALTFFGCFPENEAGCPVDMRLVFYLDDAHLPGDFDSRIGNDVQLHIFQDNKLTNVMNIPYDAISESKEFVVRKSETIQGNLKFVAWAVPANVTALPPSITEGDHHDDNFFEMEEYTRAGSNFLPYPVERYVGAKSSYEAIDQPTLHRIGLHTVSCRVVVNVTDNMGVLSTPGSKPEVVVLGTMSQMDLNFKGVGQEALVYKPLVSGDDVDYSTGRFGVMPSKEGEAVSVRIENNGSTIATLTVPANKLPQGAESGGLLIFDYTIGDTVFYITVDGFQEIIHMTGM